MTHRPRVPRLARILLAIVVPASVRDSLLADVDDAFTHPARRRPRLWYWTQAVRTLWPPTLVALYRAERRMPSAMPSQPTRQTARSIASDLRHAGRRIVRNPSVAITVAFLLTAGVASGGVVYSIFSELVRPRVGVPAADVIHVLTATDSTGTSRRNVNRLWLDDLRALPGGVPLLYSTVRDGVARFGQSPLTVRVGFVSPDYYRLVGARAALGRLPSRDATGARREALVSYRVWNTLLAGDADAIGRELYINRAPYMIAGVAPADFDGLEGAAVWIPLDDETAATARIASVQLYARVDDATSVATLTSPVAGA